VGVIVSEVLTVDDAVVESLIALVTQMSSQTAEVVDAMIRESISSTSTRVLMATRDGSTVGTLTLVEFAIPSGRRAWIEDVVVDEASRRQGVGEALVSEAISIAHSDGMRTVELTSRPSRTEARRLYEKLGFEVRETSVFRYTVSD
jgi:ribosomal protein S18 acetylase RimI-like enzyme